MHITKHVVHTVVDTGVTEEVYFNTKHQAVLYESNTPNSVYVGVALLDLYCEECGDNLDIGQNYIKLDELTRYCSRCFESKRTIAYFIDGEYIGDASEIQEYDDWDKEA